MKLIELNPRWVGAGGEGVYNADGTPAEERHGVGISFDCPCGKEECGKVFVTIDPPMDGKGPWDNNRYSWKRTGDTFETLTLTPSILRVKGHTDVNGGWHDYHNCGWHGFITNGEVITV
jgi:hypothetical protein